MGGWPGLAQMTIREKELPAHPQGQCVHQQDSGSLLLHLSASLLTSLALPCSPLSPEDSRLLNGVGGGMGRGSLAVGGKLQVSLFWAPAAVASAPSRAGTWSRARDDRHVPLRLERLSSQGARGPAGAPRALWPVPLP